EAETGTPLRPGRQAKLDQYRIVRRDLTPKTQQKVQVLMLPFPAPGPEPGVQRSSLRSSRTHRPKEQTRNGQGQHQEKPPVQRAHGISLLVADCFQGFLLGSAGARTRSTTNGSE